MLSIQAKSKLCDVICIILLLVAVILFFIGVMHKTTEPPNRIKDFCRAQFEIYGKNFEECIDMYKNRTK